MFTYFNIYLLRRLIQHTVRVFTLDMKCSSRNNITLMAAQCPMLCMGHGLLPQVVSGLGKWEQGPVGTPASLFPGLIAIWRRSSAASCEERWARGQEPWALV